MVLCRKDVQYILDLHIIEDTNLDVVSSLAEVSILNNFVRPSILDDQSLLIIGGRHPSVELVMQKSGESKFFSNDCHLNKEDKIWLLTGPNMAGKSTFLRQNAQR